MLFQEIFQAFQENRSEWHLCFLELAKGLTKMNILHASPDSFRSQDYARTNFVCILQLLLTSILTHYVTVK